MKALLKTETNNTFCRQKTLQMQHFFLSVYEDSNIRLKYPIPTARHSSTINLQTVRNNNNSRSVEFELMWLLQIL